MSRECHFVEYRTGEWYLVLANREHGRIDYNDTTCVGSFATMQDVDDYLSDNYSNPGGMTIYRPDNVRLVDAYLIINSCEKPNTKRNWW